MDTDYLKTFVTLAETKSYEQTAEELFISRATISHRMARLIALVGFDPFITRRSDVALNSRGVELLSLAKEILLLEEKAVSLGSNQSSEMNVRIGVGEMMAMTTVLPLLRKLQKKYPNVNFSVDTNNYVGIKEKLIRGSIDVGITWEEPELSTFYKEKLCNCYFGVLLTETHPLAGRESVSMREVLRYPLILRQSNTMSRKYFTDYVSRRKAKYDLALEVSNSSALESAITHGFGGENAVSISTTMFALETTNLRWIPIPEAHISEIMLYSSKKLATKEPVLALGRGMRIRLQSRIERVFGIEA